MPHADPIELVAGRAGRWFLVSEQLLIGTTAYAAAWSLRKARY
jgi:hypothetical protein